MLEKPAEVMLSLMTATEPTVQAGGVKIGGTLLLFDQKQLNATIERIAVTDASLKHSWNEVVYRLKLDSAGPVAKATWKLELRSA